jgi:hypothetical protein
MIKKFQELLNENKNYIEDKINIEKKWELKMI